MKGQAWTKDEEDFLRDNFVHMTHSQIGLSLGRSVNAVKNRASLRGLIKKHYAKRIGSTKQCKDCKQFLELSNFNKQPGSRDGKGYLCKECSSKRFTAYREKNASRLNGNFQKWNIGRYGLSIERYKEMLANQNGLCAICGKSESDECRALSIDHCHDTGVVRGLLCGSCNMALGLFKDSADILLKAVEYLEAKSK